MKMIFFYSLFYRVNMEIISNKILLLFSHCMKMEKGSLKNDTNGSAVGKNIDLHQLYYLLINHHPRSRNNKRSHHRLS